MFLTGQQVGYSLRGEGFRLGGLAFGFGLLCCLPFPFCGLCLAELCIRRRLLRESIPLYVGLAGAFGRGQCLSLAFFDAPPLVGDADGVRRRLRVRFGFQAGCYFPARAFGLGLPVCRGLCFQAFSRRVPLASRVLLSLLTGQLVGYSPLADGSCVRSSLVSSGLKRGATLGVLFKGSLQGIGSRRV